MIIEIKVLVLAALWHFFQFILMAVLVNRELGVGKTVSSRDLTKLGGSIESQVSIRTARLIRALDNHFEALILFTLLLHKISSPEAYRAVYKAPHGVFTGLSLVILNEIQEK